MKSNIVSAPVNATAPAIFAADATGKGAGFLSADYKSNRPANSASVDNTVLVIATGAGVVTGGAKTGSIGAVGSQALPMSAAIGEQRAKLVYAGPAPGLASGVVQLNLSVATGTASGAQPVVFTAGAASSQVGITVFVK